MSDLEAFKSSYLKHGYAILPGLIPPEGLAPLRAAAERATARTRSGAWPHRRTVGRQFPPFDEPGVVDCWGVQHLMHPALGERAFAEWYTSDGLVRAVVALLKCDGERELQMGMCV